MLEFKAQASLSHNFSVLPFTATWLKPETHCAELFPACVYVLKKDISNKVGGDGLISVSSLFGSGLVHRMISIYK